MNPSVPELRRIRPALLLALDDEAAALAADTTLALARRHPDALRFFATTRFHAKAGETNAERLRTVWETITDLGARQRAILRGNEMVPEVRAFVALFLGTPLPPGTLEQAVETLHRVGANFYDLPLEVHLLLFLPDLEQPADREARYAQSYRQLGEADRLARPDRALAFRPHSSVDGSWLFDAQTRVGAHAGAIADVREPAAEMLALLLGAPDPGPLALGAADAAVLRGRVHERLTAYSTFGAATLFHAPEPLLRAVAAAAAVEHLTAYLEGAGDESDIAAAAEAAASAWAAQANLASRLGDALPSGALAATSVPRDRQQALRREQRRANLRALRDELFAALRTWLADGGVAAAERTLRLLGEGAPTLPNTSLPALWAEWQADLYRFLRLDVMRTELRALDAEEARVLRDLRQGEVGSDEPRTTALGEELAAVRTRREQVREQLAERTPLLDLANPDALEDALLRVAAEPPYDPAFGVAKEEAPPARIAEPWDRRAQRWARRGTKAARRGWSAARGWTAPGARQEPTDRDSAVSDPVLPHPSALPATDPAALAERAHGLKGYAEVVRSVQHALEAHRETLRTAVQHYHDSAAHLTRHITDGSRFVMPVLQPVDVAAYTTRFAPTVRAALAESRGTAWLAQQCRPDPVSVEPFQNPLLIQLPGFDDALMQSARTEAAAITDETLADVLAGRTLVPERFPLRDWVRVLLDTSEPLARPSVSPGAAEHETIRRGVYGNEALRELLGSDASPNRLLNDAAVQWLPDADPNLLTFTAVRHGFPAHALRRLVPLRAHHHHSADGSADPSLDVVPLASAREGERAPWFRTVVLAHLLDLVHAEDGGFRVDDLHVAGDLLSLTEALAASVDHRGIAQQLEQRVDAVLLQPDALERLRTARERPDLAATERDVALEMIAELEAQTLWSWEQRA